MRDFFLFWWECLILSWTAFNNLAGVVSTISVIIMGLLLFRQRFASNIPQWEDNTKIIVSIVFLVSVIAAIFVSPYILYRKAVDSSPSPETIQDRPEIGIDKVQMHFKPQFESIEIEVSFINYGNKAAKNTDAISTYLFTKETLEKFPSVEFDDSEKNNTAIYMPNSLFRSILQISRSSKMEMYDILINNETQSGNLYLYGKVEYADNIFHYEYRYFYKYDPTIGVFRTLNTSETAKQISNDLVK